MKIYTTYYASPLGKLKIQCSDEHLKAVVFCEGKDADSESDNHLLLQKSTTQLDEYFTGKRKEFDLPLQQYGTGFQQKVWDLLCQIPFGKTISYHQLAAQYGDLKAIRAVASANGKNNLAIIVPCHRVIGSNQSLTGYAGGLWRKKWLLEHEAKHHVGVEQLGLMFSE
jgi:methylated-DNA-[protein]-cysteine S-methyltransferase